MSRRRGAILPARDCPLPARPVFAANPNNKSFAGQPLVLFALQQQQQQKNKNSPISRHLNQSKLANNPYILKGPRFTSHDHLERRLAQGSSLGNGAISWEQ